MPFSTNPVYVGDGDTIQVRYPTPATWDTEVTVNVKIGTGQDSDGVTFSTKIPDATAAQFSVADQAGYAAAWGGDVNSSGSPSGLGTLLTTFLPGNTYYSQVFTLSGFEIPLEANISATSEGPKTTGVDANSTAEYRIWRPTDRNNPQNGGSFEGTWRTSISASLTNLDSGVQPGDKIQLRCTVPESYATHQAVTFTTTDNGISGRTWTSTSTSHTWDFTSREQDQQIVGWVFTDAVDLVPAGTVTENRGTGDEYLYEFYDIGERPITSGDPDGIDFDVVLRCLCTGDIEVYNDTTGSMGASAIQSQTTGWTQNTNSTVVGGDRLWFRLAVGGSHTEKTSGTVDVRALDSATYTRSSTGNSYENIPVGGTYGDGNYEVTQTQGQYDTNWQAWTEVDRYPDPVSASPLYTYGIAFDVIVNGDGYALNTEYTTTATTGGGSGMKIKLISGGVVNTSPAPLQAPDYGNYDYSGKTNIFVTDPGYGYVIGDELTVDGVSGTNIAKIKITEYQKVYVSNSGTTTATAEAGFMYFADMDVSGLGNEYAANAYSDLTFLAGQTGATNLPSTQSPAEVQAAAADIASVSGTTVTIFAVADGDGLVRKNNTGTWTTSVVVENGDELNFKIPADSNYGQSNASTIEFLGPPQPPNLALELPTGQGGGNGAAGKSYDNIVNNVTINTRSARRLPYQFHATPVFVADPESNNITEVFIEGIDPGQTATVSVTQGGSNGGIAKTADGPFLQTISSFGPDDRLFVNLEASPNSNVKRTLSYQFSAAGTSDTVSDIYSVTTRQFNDTEGYAPIQQITGGTVYADLDIPSYAIGEFYVTLIGAGGGNGGCDAPNSEGGVGGSGNHIKVQVSLSPDDFPTVNALGNPDYKIRVWAPKAGENGLNFSEGSGGGAGGFGYSVGGTGGFAGPGTAQEPNDKSGGGGGGGGAAAISLLPDPNNGNAITLLAMAGGGGGGAGAGNDTLPADTDAHGNYSSHGTLQTTTVNIGAAGENGTSNPGSGGGGGGGGGGYVIPATGGGLKSSPDSFGNIDLDGQGGQGGGAYYNPTYCTQLFPPTSSLVGGGAGPGESGSIIIEYGNQDVDPILIGDYSPQQSDPNTEVESDDLVQVTDITGSITVAATSVGWTVQVASCTFDGTNYTCGPYTNSLQVENDEYIRLKGVTGPTYNFPYKTTVSFGAKEKQWTVSTGAVPVSLPGSFSFEDVDPAPRSFPDDPFIQYSETIFVSQVSIPVPVIIGGDATDVEVSINGGPWLGVNPLGSVGDVEATQSIQLRLTTAEAYSTTTFATIRIGDSDLVTWNVKTEPEGNNYPNPEYAFLPLTNQELNDTVLSNPVQIDGINEPIRFIVDNHPTLDESAEADPPVARVYKNAVLQDAQADGTTDIEVEDGDWIRLEYTTSNEPGEGRVFRTRAGIATSTLGYYPADWSVTNAGSFGQTPEKFLFNPVFVDPDTYGVAVETPTLAGLGQGVTLQTYSGLEVRIGFDGATPSGTYQTYPNGSSFTVDNGDILQVRLKSSIVPGVPRTGAIRVGEYSTTFVVQAIADVEDPIEGQWYSAIQPVSYQPKTDNSSIFPAITMADYATYDQVRASTKYDGIPVGGIIPVFQDATNDDGWGDLYGTKSSRFPGFIYCDGDSYNPEDYPLLFDVLQYTYGAVDVGGGETYFKVPDMRNRYIKGTGPIDGLQLSSPALSPSFGPTKEPGNVGADTPGATGGMWFVDTIADPGVGELEQVETPATNQPAQESAYFGIATVITTGYNDVSGIVEFDTVGSCGVNMALKPLKLYDVPTHTHEVIMGQADPGNFKGMVFWGQEGGYRVKVTTDAQIGKQQDGPYDPETTIYFNMWGYPTTSQASVGWENLPGSNKCNKGSFWWDGTTDGFDNKAGYQGVDDAGSHNPLNLTFGALNPHLDEIDNYIDIQGTAFDGLSSGNVDGGTDIVWKQIAAVDIPRRTTNFKQFKPVPSLEHTHYLSQAQIPQNPDDANGLLYAYGNVEGGGTKNTGLNTFQASLPEGFDLDEIIEMKYTVDDIGLTVLPGTFTLSASKQLIPEPSFAPQSKVAVMSPYTWVKWMIKAY